MCEPGLCRGCKHLEPAPSCQLSVACCTAGSTRTGGGGPRCGPRARVLPLAALIFFSSSFLGELTWPRSLVGTGYVPDVDAFGSSLFSSGFIPLCVLTRIFPCLLPRLSWQYGCCCSNPANSSRAVKTPGETFVEATL